MKREAQFLAGWLLTAVVLAYLLAVPGPRILRSIGDAKPVPTVRSGH